MGGNLIPINRHRCSDDDQCETIHFIRGITTWPGFLISLFGIGFDVLNIIEINTKSTSTKSQSF